MFFSHLFVHFCRCHVNLYRKFCNSICINGCSILTTVCTTYKLNIKKYIICDIIQYEVAIGYISIYSVCYLQFPLVSVFVRATNTRKVFPGVVCGRFCACNKVRAFGYTFSILYGFALTKCHLTM